MFERFEREGRTVRSRWAVAAALAAAGCGLVGADGRAETYYYDANTTSAGTGGTGSWNTSSLVNWRVGAVDGALSKWPGSTPAGTAPPVDPTAVAVFGDVAGNVTLGAGVSIVLNRINFETTGFQIRPNGTAVLNFSGANPTVHTDVALATLRTPYQNGFEKTGTGTLVLDYFSTAPAATFAGGTVTLSEGTLRNASQYGFGTQPARANLVMNGGTLDLNGFTGVGTPGQVATGEVTSIGSLSGATGTIMNNGALAATLKVGTGSSASTTFGGIIQDGAQAAKLLIGSGGSTPTLTLTGDSTHTGGTEVNSGTLRLDDGGSLGRSNIAITGGSLAGGTTGPGGTLHFNINGDVADLISIAAGSLELANLALDLDLSGAQTLAEYVLADKAVGSAFVTGSAFGSELLPAGWDIDYDGTLANPGAIVLVAPVPEPSAVAAIGLALATTLVRRRRR